MRVSARVDWLPPSSTSNPVAFRRTPPPASAAAIPSLTTHQNMDPNMPSRRWWVRSSSASTTSAIIDGISVNRPARPKAMSGAGTRTSHGASGVYMNHLSVYPTIERAVDTRNARPLPSAVPILVTTGMTRNVDTAPSVPAYPANSAPVAWSPPNT